MKTRSENVQIGLVHARKVHSKSSNSPLDNESPVQDYRGFHNLVMLLLFVNNLRLVVENYLKYGLLIKVPTYDGISQDLTRCILALLWQLLPILLIFWIEKSVAWSLKITSPNKAHEDNDERSESPITLHSRPAHGSSGNIKITSLCPPKSTTPLWAKVLNFCCISLMVVVTNVYVFYEMNTPFLASLPCFWSMILLMKMISYILVNAELRSLNYTGHVISDYEPSEAYPRNLSLSNLAYFLMAPTLCYQPSYPRTDRVRKAFLVKRLFEIASLLGMMWFISEQYSRPTLLNSLRPFHELNVFSLFERVLKLSLPSIYIWLLMFYAFFHSYLNLWAELLRFGDREFYKPWWNASTIAQYWRLWNIPVYAFFKRHVYVPLRVNNPNVPRMLANAAAFFISAVGHEIVIGVPLHILQGWAFGGMLFQIPMIWLSEVLYSFEKKRQKKRRGTNTIDEDEDLEGRPVNIGNYLFWITFCVVGQPFCVLLYYRAYYMRENPDLVAAAIKIGSNVRSF